MMPVGGILKYLMLDAGYIGLGMGRHPIVFDMDWRHGLLCIRSVEEMHLDHKLTFNG